MYTIIIIAILVVIIAYILTLKRHHNWDTSMVRSTSNTKVIIFSSYDDRFSKKPYVQKNYEILKRYAKKNGHVYQRIISNDISPYWLRVRDLQRIMYANPENTLIAYFDADAIPAHDDISIGSFVDSLNSPESDIFISEDPYLRYTFNTGVFIVRNTKRCREFVDKWMSTYNKLNWSKNGEDWSCGMCLYSGLNYEQGSFNKLYRLLEDKTLVKNLESNVLDGSAKADDTFSIHLMNTKDSVRDSTFQEYL